jgi:hypothetical protein
LLWKYDRRAGRWIELTRHVGQGTEWQEAFKAIAFREIGRNAPPIDAAAAAAVSGRVLCVLDSELELLGSEERMLVMNYVYQEFSARAVTYA